MIYIVLSFDDASRYIIKCAKLLDKYNLKGTFYLDIKRTLWGGLSYSSIYKWGVAQQGQNSKII